jgi:hypothetical protein
MIWALGIIAHEETYLDRLFASRNCCSSGVGSASGWRA